MDAGHLYKGVMDDRAVGRVFGTIPRCCLSGSVPPIVLNVERMPLRRGRDRKYRETLRHTARHRDVGGGLGANRAFLAALAKASDCGPRLMLLAYKPLFMISIIRFVDGLRCAMSCNGRSEAEQ